MIIDDALVRRLHASARADRWSLSVDDFRAALTASAAAALSRETARPRAVERYLEALHLEDLALAAACALGLEAAWDHVMTEYRPALYRAADALDPGGSARELADSLYADLYGLQSRGGERRSLFRYFHGRSSLATWLRSVLAQRYVDSIRSRSRLTPLAEADTLAAADVGPPDADSERCRSLVQGALAAAIARLQPRDRLRLGCYYARQLTLAETGRILHEHEATVSRQLARTRKAIRAEVEGALRAEAGMTSAQIDRCFELAAEDAGALDLDAVFTAAATPDAGRKIPDRERSQ